MSKKKPVNRSQPLQPFFQESFFHNNGDNPAFKKFIEIARENSQEAKLLDRRVYVIDKGVRFLYARNWEDFLQRDLKAITFPRAFGIFVLNSMALFTVSVWTRNLLPVGKFGIRNVYQTSFYNNFGPLGLIGAGSMMLAAAYTQWKTFKFTAHKFYRHVLLGDRNWVFEGEKSSRYALYQFQDDPLGNQSTFPAIPTKLVSMLKRSKPTYKGVYGKSSDQE